MLLWLRLRLRLSMHRSLRKQSLNSATQIITTCSKSRSDSGLSKSHLDKPADCLLLHSSQLSLSSFVCVTQLCCVPLSSCAHRVFLRQRLVRVSGLLAAACAGLEAV